MFPYRLYLITDDKILGRQDLIEVVESAVRGGVDLVQYRDKSKPLPEQIEEAGRLKERLDRIGVPLIINDHSKVARLTAAAGVHLGQHDQSIREAREFLPNAWIGVSTHSLDQAMQAAAAGATYIGLGPVFTTETKPQDKRKEFPLGTTILRKILLSVPGTPVFPIGGIDIDNAADVLAGGAHRLAVCSAILGAADPEKAARKFRDLLDKKLDGRYGGQP